MDNEFTPLVEIDDDDKLPVSTDDEILDLDEEDEQDDNQ